MNNKTVSFLLAFLFSLALSSQQFEWTKQFSGSSYEMSFTVAMDSYDNSYIAGYFVDTVDFDPTAGVLNYVATEEDMFVAKFDPNGNFVWVKIVSGPGFEVPFGITVDHNNDLLITGGFDAFPDFDPGSGVVIDTSFGDEDPFVLKLDSNGNFIWLSHLGGPGDDEGVSIAVDSANNVYTTGAFQIYGDFDPGPGVFTLNGQLLPNLYVSKLSSNGNFIWAKNIDGYSVGTGITLDNNENPLVTGYFYGTQNFDLNAGTYNLTSNGDRDCFILKLDTSGNMIWAKSFGGTGEDKATAVKSDPSGSVYSTGYFNSNTDFDPGSGVFNMSAILRDAFVLKLDSSGNFVFAKQITGIDNQLSNTIDLDVAGNIYFGGSFNDATDFDTGPGSQIISSYLSQDCIYICKLNPSGNLIWALPFGTLGEVYSLGIDHANNIYSTGYFYFAGDFDPFAGQFTLTPVGEADVFHHKMSQGPAGITENNNALSFQLYPNPAAEEIYILAEEQWKTYQIVNMTGDLVKEGSRSISISIQDLPSGIYIFRLINEEGEISQKKFVRF